MLHRRLLPFLACWLLGYSVEGSEDENAVLFEEHFSLGLAGWRGKHAVPIVAKNATLVAGPECPGGEGTCVKLGGCTFQGALFSTSAVLCTLAEPCIVSFQHRGGIWQGFSDGFPGRHLWTASPVPEGAGGHIVDTAMSDWAWARTEYQFPVQPNFVWDNDKHAALGQKIGPVHFMAEVYSDRKDDPHCKDTYLADIRISRSRNAQQSPPVSVFRMKKVCVAVCVFVFMAVTSFFVFISTDISLSRMRKLQQCMRREAEPLRQSQYGTADAQYHSYTVSGP